MAGKNLATKLIESHLVEGKLEPGEEIGLKIDQTLTQDATGTMVMLELEAMGLDRVKTEVSAQYVDHNLLQTDFKNPDDHLFLQSACEKFGIWYSRPGNGVSHPVHMERLGIPGKSLVGSDSHTPAAGSLGMLAIGAGGLEVAMAMAGEPLYIPSPEIMGVKLTGELPDWCSSKDIILEMLRRYDVDGGRGKIIEYCGPGIKTLSAMERHVITNMGTELGATTSVFPSDNAVKVFLNSQGRVKDYVKIEADKNAEYDYNDEIDLSEIEPLIALPSSPGKVKAVADVAGKEIYQATIGSSANPAFRDFAVPALMVKDKQVHKRISFDINPASRQIEENLMEQNYLFYLLQAGGRIHQAGCNGCIGMGQAPATNKISLRTVPRNFPGRSGTKEDKVYLCSPETSTASALTGLITDPKTLDMKYPRVKEPTKFILNTSMLIPPNKSGKGIKLQKGPNIKSLPLNKPLQNKFEAPVILKMGDDISTDEILPAGSKVLPFRSNIPMISKFTLAQVDDTFYNRAIELKSSSGSILVGGENYGQGSSREHAAIAPMFLGVKTVIAKSFARIHKANLINFGIVPLEFVSSKEYNKIKQGDKLLINGIKKFLLTDEDNFTITNLTQNKKVNVKAVELSRKFRDIIIAGGKLNWIKNKK